MALRVTLVQEAAAGEVDGAEDGAAPVLAGGHELLALHFAIQVERAQGSRAGGSPLRPAAPPRRAVRRLAHDPPRLLSLHGARSSPHDNPVERIWGALKAWLANNPTLTIQGRIRQVHAYFRQRTSAQLLTTAAPHSSPWLPQGHVQNSRQAA
jgi:hypothetical protein